MTSAKHFFDEEHLRDIVAAIQSAELKTSGEVRVYIENHCGKDVLLRAKKVFEKLGMTATKQRNGILFYLAVKDHQFAVLGDKGIHEHVHGEFWQEVKEAMAKDFAVAEFSSGLINGIQMAGERLSEYFPIQEDDVNELDDEISFGPE